VSRALECAAREVERLGTEATHVRLYTLFTSSCSACGGCRASGRCSVRSRSLDDVAEMLVASDLLLVGVVSSVSQRDARAEALLRRLVGCFGEVYDHRRGERSGPGAQCLKSAALVSSAPPLLGVAAALGVLPYGLSGVWRVLDRAGVDVVGTATVARRWSGPASWDVTRERAVRLGKTLASSAGPRPAAVRVPAPALQPSIPPAVHVRVA
jgi:hypothetical protein